MCIAGFTAKINVPEHFEVVKTCQVQLRYASDELKDDYDIGLLAVRSNGLALDQAGLCGGKWRD